MALSDAARNTFLSIVPALSLVLTIILLQFFSEFVFRTVEKLLKPSFRSFMQKRIRFILDLMPNFDSFLAFLITLLIITPFLTIIMRDVFTPFLRSLANNLFIMAISTLIILFLVYFGFERWYIRRFKYF